VYICWDFKVTACESAFLIGLYPGYVLYSYYGFAKEEKIETESENNNNISNIKKSLPWTK